MREEDIKSYCVAQSFFFLLSAWSTSCPKEGQLLCKNPGIERAHRAEPQSTHSHHRQNIMWEKSKLVIVKPLFGACYGVSVTTT